MRNTLVTNLLIQGITFGTSVLTARILGPVGRGELAAVLLYPQLVASMWLLGVDRAVAVRAGRGDMPHPTIAIVIITLLLSLPAIIVAYCVIHMQINDLRLASLSTQYIAYIPAVYFFMLSAMLFNGIGEFKRFNRVRLGFYISNLLALVFIWALHPQYALQWVLAANLVSVYIVFLLAIFLLRGMPVSARDHSRHLDIRSILIMALPFALPAAMGHFAAVAYQVVLEQRTSAAAFGSFLIMYSYSRLLSPVGNAVGSHIFRLGISGAHCELASVFRRGWIVYLCCALPLGIVAQWLIPAVFGQDFPVDILSIAALLMACVFALSADSMAEFLKGRAMVRTDTIALALSLSVTFCGGWLLVPRVGIVGMALAMVIAEFIRCSLLAMRAAAVSNTKVICFCQPSSDDISELLHALRSAFGKAMK